MGTKTRPEVSEKNDYYIPRHRYYELLHFCRQYTDYMAEKEQILAACVRPVVANHTITTDVMASHRTDHMERWAIRLADVDDKIKLIEQAAVDADEALSGYILMSVTSGLGYDTMNARYNVPCSRNTFYDRYRKFFWILDQRRR